MPLEELLKVRLEKQRFLDQDECDKLGLYGEGLCEFDNDEDEDEEEDY